MTIVKLFFISDVLSLGTLVQSAQVGMFNLPCELRTFVEFTFIEYEFIPGTSVGQLTSCVTALQVLAVDLRSQ